MEINLYNKIRYNKGKEWWAPIIHPDVDQDIWALYWLMKIKEKIHNECDLVVMYPSGTYVEFFYKDSREGKHNRKRYLYEDDMWNSSGKFILNTGLPMYEQCKCCYVILIDDELYQNLKKQYLFTITWLRPDLKYIEHVAVDEIHYGENRSSYREFLGINNIALLERNNT